LKEKFSGQVHERIPLIFECTEESQIKNRNCPITRSISPNTIITISGTSITGDRTKL
jgi:hypothetical protein